MSAAEAVALLLYASCWGTTLTCSCLLVSIAPTVATVLGSSARLAPFTCGVFCLGCALASIPSVNIFGAFGRIGGFLCGALVGMLGGVLALLTVRLGLPPVGFFVASGLIGLAQGLGFFYRFAALEVCRPARKPLAMTLVLSGGAIAAFAGPQLALATRHLTPFGERGGGADAAADGRPAAPEESAERYVGACLAMIALHGLNVVLSLLACVPSGPSCHRSPRGGAVRNVEG